jgi:hypothetical protein
MKKLILALPILMISGMAMGMDVWKSSNTAATTTTLNILCTATQRAVFHGACTDFGVASASYTIVGSTWSYTANTTVVGPVTTLVADQCKYFDIRVNYGMSYFKNNAAGVTFMYECY